jgi:hypothetical protein
MLGRPRVCRAAEIAKVPLITAHRPAAMRSSTNVSSRRSTAQMK